MTKKRLSNNDLMKIKLLIDNGYSISVIARQFNVSRDNIYKLAYKNNWKFGEKRSIITKIWVWLTR